MLDSQSTLDRVFNVPPGNSVPLTGDLLICNIITTSPDILQGQKKPIIQLFAPDVRIYKDSPSCSCMAKVFKYGQLNDILLFQGNALGWDVQISDSINLLMETADATVTVVIFRNEDPSMFVDGYFSTFQDFYVYLKFADKHGFNIPFICTQTDKTLWLLDIGERQKAIWRNNSRLLKNIEQKFFDKNMFEFIALGAGAGAAAYPNAAPAKTREVPKYVNLGEVKPPDVINKSYFEDAVQVLLNNGAKDFVARMVAVLGSSIEHCDVIYGLAGVIKAVRGLPPFQSATFYAFRVFYLEELAMYHGKRGVGRFILPINTVATLPTYSTGYLKSPYLCTLVNRSAIRNGPILPALVDIGRGVYSLDEFRMRLRTYTFGAFDNVQFNGSVEVSVKEPSAKTSAESVWNNNNALVDNASGGSTGGGGSSGSKVVCSYRSALNGSLITACAIRTPMEKAFDSLEDYFMEYYPYKKIKKQQQQTLNVIPVFGEEEGSDEEADNAANDSAGEDSGDEEVVNPADNIADVGVPRRTMRRPARRRHRPSRRAAMMAKLDDADEQEDPAGGAQGDAAAVLNDGRDHTIDYSDIDFMIETNDVLAADGSVLIPALDIFDQVAQAHFESIQATVMSMTDGKFGIAAIPKYNLVLERVVTENKHKWVITGLPRSIDMFHVNSIPAVIVKYHLGCVRAWYDGEDVHCFPSFVTAAKIGLNVDVRWTSNRKDVRDIILKYMQRGFGTVVNIQDKTSLVRYVDQMAAASIWPQLIPAQPNGHIYGYLYRVRHINANAMFLKHIGPIFNPSVSRYGIHHNLLTAGNPVDIVSVMKPSRSRRGVSDMPEFKDQKTKEVYLPGSCASLSCYL